VAVINLAPADLPKEGGRFDLPIALGVLAASQQIPLAALETIEFVGGPLRSRCREKPQDHARLVATRNGLFLPHIDYIIPSGSVPQKDGYYKAMLIS